MCGRRIGAGGPQGHMGGTRVGAGRPMSAGPQKRGCRARHPGPRPTLPRILKSSDADRKTPMLVELCTETEASQKITTQPSHPCSNRCRLKYSSTCWRLRVSMANYTRTDLLLFSAGAVLVNCMYIYIYK